VSRTFVGFGLGPIQAGLFLLEALRSGNFRRLVVSEVDRTLVEAVRRNRGTCTINVAHLDKLESADVAGVEVYDPTDPRDRPALLAAIGEAEELATAIPAVEAYTEGGQASVASLLAHGLTRGRPRIIYAAENHNFAAELLEQAVRAERPDFPRETTGFLNTVIGKMSRATADPGEMAQLGLRPLVPGFGRAYLVEAFNRILVSRVRLAGFRRGITVFEEKDSLLPFEEAKLYGHNAIHALLAYLGYVAGYDFIAEAAADERIASVARAAFLAESGAPLCRKHGRLGDPLFTPAGYQAYALDLLARMANPHLHDTVARVARQPARKLAYGDRIFGTIRLALECAVRPTRMALAAAGALLYLKQDGQLLPRGQAPASLLSPAEAEATLLRLWGKEARQDDLAPQLLALTKGALERSGEFQRAVGGEGG
jgi:mannitol-1-phosphate 5-dehydrogenase